VSQGAYDAMRGKLHRVAKYQQWFLFAVLINVVIFAVAMASAFEILSPPAGVLRGLGYVRFAMCIFMSIATFLLAKQFWHVVIATIFVAMNWVPIAMPATSFIWLIVLIILNRQSTTLLQKWGIQVGLLGANPDRI
jgi:hypothetical protein